MAGVCHAFMLDPPNFCLIHSPRSLLMAPVAPRKQAPHHRGRTFLCPPNLHLSLSCYPEISVTASCFAVDHTLQFSLTKASWCCLSASVFYFPLFLCYFSPVCGSYAPPRPFTIAICSSPLGPSSCYECQHICTAPLPLHFITSPSFVVESSSTKRQVLGLEEAGIV